jgi:hypothetical protein
MQLEHQATGKAARVFAEFPYQTHKSWCCSRRVVAKAEYLDKGENPRFVVTSLAAEPWAARDLYEKFYCARGEMESRIKEQMCLFADRLSTDEMKGNQSRLYFSALAYTLVEALRRLVLKRHCVGRGTGRYHPSQAAQDRRHRGHQRAPYPAPDEFGLPVERYLRGCFPRPALSTGAYRSDNRIFHLHRDRRLAQPCPKTVLETRPGTNRHENLPGPNLPPTNNQPHHPINSTPHQSCDCEKCRLGPGRCGVVARIVPRRASAAMAWGHPVC